MFFSLSEIILFDNKIKFFFYRSDEECIIQSEICIKIKQAGVFVKRFFIIATFFLTISLTTSLTAEMSSKTNYFGPTSLQNETHPMLTIMGPATLNNVTVTKKTTLHGPATLRNSRFQSLEVLGVLNGTNISSKTLTVKGSTSLSGVTVEGDTSIMGPFVANGGSFQDITVAADEITLKDVQVQNLYIKQNHPDHPKPQALNLEGESIIAGDIVFEGKKGIVKIKNEDVSISGNIKGGEKEISYTEGKKEDSFIKKLFH